jgi:hypothetical protein
MQRKSFWKTLAELVSCLIAIMVYPIGFIIGSLDAGLRSGYFRGRSI